MNQDSSLVESLLYHTETLIYTAVNYNIIFFSFISFLLVISPPGKALLQSLFQRFPLAFYCTLVPFSFILIPFIRWFFLLCLDHWIFGTVFLLWLLGTLRPSRNRQAAGGAMGSSVSSPSSPAGSPDSPSTPAAPDISPNHCRLWGSPYFENNTVVLDEMVAGSEVEIYLQACTAAAPQSPLRGYRYLQRFHVEIGGTVPIIPKITYLMIDDEGSVIEEYTLDEVLALEDNPTGPPSRPSTPHAPSTPVHLSSSSSSLPASLTPAHLVNTLKITFTARRTGNLSLLISLLRPSSSLSSSSSSSSTSASVPVRRSPYLFQVVPSLPDPSSSLISLASGSGVLGLTSSEASVVVHLCDHLGNPCAGQIPPFLLSQFRMVPVCVSGASVAADWHASFMPGSEGSVVCTIRPTQPGTLVFAIHFQSSPLRVDLDPKLTTISLSSLAPDRAAALSRNLKKPELSFRTSLILRGAERFQAATLVLSPNRIVAADVILMGWWRKKTYFALPLCRSVSLLLHPSDPLVLRLSLADHDPIDVTFPSEELRQEFHCTFMSLLHSRGSSWKERSAFLTKRVQTAFNSHKSAPPIRIRIDRHNLLTSAYEALESLPLGSWRSKWKVEFLREEGVDCGGLSAELFTILPTLLFHRDTGLFREFGEEQQPAAIPSSSHEVSASSNGVSSPSSSHSSTKPTNLFPSAHPRFPLSYYSFAGKLVAKALLDTQLFGFKCFLPLHFTTAFYKKLLDLPVHWRDFEIDDPSYYQSKIKMILETEITTDIAEDWDLTFTMPVRSSNGRIEQLELQPGGRDLLINEQNKPQYLEAIAKYRFDTSIDPQFRHFAEGFKFVLGDELTESLTIFDHRELEMLLSGVQEIDLVDWQTPGNMRYFECNDQSQIVKWFWIVVMNMTNTERCRLIQFITGSSQGILLIFLFIFLFIFYLFFFKFF